MRPRLRGAERHRDCETAGLPLDDLALSDVYRSPRLDAECADPFGDLVRAVNGTRRPDEAGVEAVAGRVVLSALQRARASRTTE